MRITGRKKEILVTAGGKNVAPAVLEDRIRSHGLISQCMVVGDGRPFVAALVTLDEEALQSWAAARGKAGSVATLRRDPEPARRDSDPQLMMPRPWVALGRSDPQVRYSRRRLDRGDG